MPPSIAKLSPLDPARTLDMATEVERFVQRATAQVRACHLQWLTRHMDGYGHSLYCTEAH